MRALIYPLQRHHASACMGSCMGEAGACARRFIVRVFLHTFSSASNIMFPDRCASPSQAESWLTCHNHTDSHHTNENWTDQNKLIAATQLAKGSLTRERITRGTYSSEMISFWQFVENTARQKNYQAKNKLKQTLELISVHAGPRGNVNFLLNNRRLYDLCITRKEI